MEWTGLRVIGRLDYLRRTDPGLSHLLNPPLAEHDVSVFEARHGLSLPYDYRACLLEVGDEGADPACPQRAARGTLWEDGRCSDMGITPFRPDFATWYRRWLRDPKPR